MDERLSQIEKEKQDALSKGNDLYSGLIQNNKDLYNQQMDSLKEQENIQNSMLDKSLAFQRGEIEKLKEKAQQNKDLEDRKALNDYTSFNNPYGHQAESLAERGLLNSGIPETSKLGSFNVYQNRRAMNNKVMQDAFTQYDSDMDKAILENDVQKAQGALERLKLSLSYLESYKNAENDLKQNQYSNSQNIDNNYYGRYQDTLNQINYEKEQEEKRRQYEEQFAYQKQQDALAQANWEKEYALSKSKAYSSSRSSGSGGTVLTNGSSSNNSSSTNTLQNNSNSNEIEPEKLTKTGKKLVDLERKARASFNIGVSNESEIYKSGSNYYVLSGDGNYYIDVTNRYNKYK